MKNNPDASRLAGRLAVRGDRVAQLRVAHAIRRLVASATPRGIRIAALADGIRLSGPKLRRRMIFDAALRSFGR